MSSAVSTFNDPILRRMGLPDSGNALDGSSLNGTGIAIGIADWGFDLVHPCLLDATGRRSRFFAIWDQNRTLAVADGTTAQLPGADEAVDRASLDALVAIAQRQGSRAPVDAVLDPHENYCWRAVPAEGAHGTLMASIAAGTPHAGFRGIAPGADLLGVQLAMAEHHWKEVDVSGQPTWRDWSPAGDAAWSGWRDYDAQLQFVAALDFLHDRARSSGAAGLVINLSLGAAAGAHDGGSIVEQRIADLISSGDSAGGLPTVVVIAAGNSGADEGHFAGEVRPGAVTAFGWHMGSADPTPNKLEIWYRSQRPLLVELLLGGHDTSRRPHLATFAIGCGPTVPISLGGRLVGIADHAHDLRNGLSRARIILHPPYFPPAMPRSGDGDIAFTLRLSSTGHEPVAVNAWLERDDGLAERSRLSPCHPAGTLGSIAMAQGAIAVAGFDHRESPTGSRMFALSSLGPAPWPALSSDPAPHIAAPGLGIWGARSGTGGFARTSGTSPAAALVSGAVALLMQQMLREGGPIRASDIRSRLAALAAPVEPDGTTAWSPRYGWGAVNVQHLFGEVRP